LRIAVLSDIHGNAEALKNTLKDASEIGVDRLFVLGDLIGYYYEAATVLSLLRRWPIDTIRGNHERLLAEALSSAAVADIYRKKYGSALDVAQATLSPQDIEWLLALPDHQTVSCEGLEFELCHGSPRSRDEYVYPDASAESLDACRVEGRDFVLMGHTHYPLLDATQKCILLNPGSVGQPRDVGGSASWCCIDTRERRISYHRSPFDFQTLAAEARWRDPKIAYLADVLEREVASGSSAMNARF
jgi:putative phosphoesterase